MSTSNVMDWCDTEIKTIPHSFKWTIKGFNPYSRHNLRSGTFFSYDEHGDEIEWILELHFLNEDYIYASVKAIKIHVTCEALVIFSILDTQGRKAVSMSSKKDTEFGKNCYHMDKLIRKDIISADANRFYPKNVLTILCEIHVKCTPVTTMKSQCLSSKKAQETKCTLRADLGNLLAEKKFCDVIIKLKDGKELQAHKIVLAASSKVFAAMFEHKMNENVNNCVNIEDFDNDVCEEMLRYIYTGKVSKLDEMCDELLAVADKYDLNGLKSICEQKLASDLSMENAAKKLVLIDRYGLEELKDQTMQLLNENAKEFIKSAEFKEIQRNYPDLLKELYISPVTNK